MRENRSSGSVEGVVRNHDPYSDCLSSNFLRSDWNWFDKTAAEGAALHSYSKSAFATGWPAR